MTAGAVVVEEEHLEEVVEHPADEVEERKEAQRPLLYVH